MTSIIHTPTRCAERQPRPSWRSAGLLLLLALAAGHGCLERAHESIEDSQTHFLRSCSSDCEAGLDCVCGVCTRPCELDLECGTLADGATCSEAAPAACPGATPSCTLECSVDVDCGTLASDMRCVSGRCQGPALPATLRQRASANTAVGQPCVTGDESFANFSGFTLGEVNIEGFGGTCGAERVCLVNQFQGRVSCPEGQSAGELGTCFTPDGEPVSVPVEPALESRPAERHVICSCRCAGPDRNADYCDCPSGMQCEELVASAPGLDDYAGSYCTYPTPPDPLEDPSERLDTP